ncbi:MAG: hypothetical protein RR497_04950 [Oscillospiraceae bacterium]
MDTKTTKTTPNSENDQAKERKIYPMPMDYEAIEHRKFMELMYERRARREKEEADKQK